MPTALKRTLVPALCAVLAASAPRPAGAQVDFVFSRFEQYLEALRKSAGIPGLSVAIVDRGRVVYEAGLGFADLQQLVRPSPDTPFYVGDLSQMFGAAMTLQCVEWGALTLDAPLRPPSPRVPEPGATIRHVLTHTSEGTPGETFSWSPERFAALTAALESCYKTDYRDALATYLLDPLAMAHSTPGLDFVRGDQPAAVTDAPGLPVIPPPVQSVFEKDWLDHYKDVLASVAKPYQVDRRGTPALSRFPTLRLNAATGVVASARDLVKFDASLDQFFLLRESTLAAAWSIPLSTKGKALPHALGWFVQTYNGEPLVWQFGYTPNVGSALYLKAPRRGLTLILLANSDGLSSSFALASGDVTSSVFARVFLNLFL
jgi:CubicO group peptidase (beta-lactamase class C family)